MSGQEELQRAARAWLEDFEAFGIEELPIAGVGEASSGDLESVAAEAESCTRCTLHESRGCSVPGQGSASARLMFVGEAPGADEDREGLAFVGRAGQLLTRMIAAMGFSREDVFIANILKCRPPQNRVPRPEEVVSCLPFLRRQIEAIGPQVLVALGATAAKNLLGVEESVGRLRQRVHDLDGTPLVVTYHPSYLLRSPGEKKKAWEDLQRAMTFVDGP